jgi:SAM-dependent methyltransferase
MPTSGRLLWERTGARIHPFFDAPSTRYYLACEKALFLDFFPSLKGKRLLKTDLWDEAKNTRILKWAEERGARVYGVDISLSILKEARVQFDRTGRQRRFVLSDVRQIAFGANSFDYLYSMGTVEHFPEFRLALKECWRVLKPGGRAVIGVPNKSDPFLRPLLVWLLNRLSLYAYGLEKSFSRRELETLLLEAGFEVEGRTGILFLPGWLRLVDLWLHVRWPGLSFLVAPLIAPFAALYKRFRFLRQHGYLIAFAVRKKA